jgi:GntR family transcriptional regulator
MAPRAQRTAPPYVQITEHYRQQILAGTLPDGAQLPTIKQLAEEWGVATATASKAVSQLQVEQFVRTSPQGTFVQAVGHVTHTPRDRIVSIRRPVAGEQHRVTAAELVPAPLYVAELMALPVDGQVIRREWITAEHSAGVRRPCRLSVSWFAPELTEQVPELLAAEPIPEGETSRIGAATGRRVTHGHDHLRGRAADAREADALGLAVGSPILAGVHLWSDPDGVIEYGEWVLPPDRTVSYEYAVTETDAMEDSA